MSKEALVSHAGGDLSGLLDIYSNRPYINRRGQSCKLVSFVDNAGKTQFKEQVLQNNAGALLRYDEWKDLDKTIINIAVDRLVGIADLQAAGLTHNLGSIGVTISQWDKSSDMTDANVDMDGVTAGEEDAQAFTYDSVPVPIIHKDFRINIRRLEASRRFGEALDTTQAAVAARKVAEKSEDMLFSGTAIQTGGGTVYGYMNYPNRNTIVLGSPWSSLATGANGEVLEGVIRMLEMARADKFHGPFMLYVPGHYEAKLNDDYRSNDSRTIKDRILQLDGISGVKVVDRMPGDNIVLVQMTSDVVDLAIARPITNVQWSSYGGMQEHFKVMAAWAPRVKSDYDGKCGIVHGTFSS